MNSYNSRGRGPRRSSRTRVIGQQQTHNNAPIQIMLQNNTNRPKQALLPTPSLPPVQQASTGPVRNNRRTMHQNRSRSTNYQQQRPTTNRSVQQQQPPQQQQQQQTPCPHCSDHSHTTAGGGGIPRTRSQTSLRLIPNNENVSRIHQTQQQAQQQQQQQPRQQQLRRSKRRRQGGNVPQGTVEKKKKKSKAQHKRSRSAYKPYHLLTWEEKKRLAKVEEEKALKRVKEYEALGGKAAPHNTTQFIIEESEQGMDFDREASPVPSRLSELNAIDPDGSEVDEEQAEQYVESDFEDQFNVVQRDMFSQMTKQELIDHCIETHREREFLSSKLARLEVDFQRIREENERIKKKVLEDQVNIITRRGTNYPPPPLFRQESEPGENSTSNSIGSSVAAGENSVSDSAESVGEDVGSQSVAGAGAQDNSVCGDERAISLADSGVAEQSGMEI